MKKNWLYVSAFLFMCAGIMIVGCPSEPDDIPPPEAIGNPDIKLFNGIGETEITVGAINRDSEYDLIIDVEAVDEELLVCHFQGRLFYEDGGIRYLLASSQDAYPNNIAKNAKKYRWVFKAFHLEGSEADVDTEDDEREYDVPEATVDAVPVGAKVIFQLIAKTPTKWENFGKAPNEPKWSFIPRVTGGNYKTEQTEAMDYARWGLEPGVKFKSDIVFRTKKPAPTNPGEQVYLSTAESEYNPKGKGNILDDEWKKIKDAPEGSTLRVNSTVTVAAKGTSGSSGVPEAGWGFAEIGGNAIGEFLKVRGQNQVAPLLVPNDKTTAGSYTFDLDILIEDILMASDPDWSFVNLDPSQQIQINSMVIYKPAP